MAKTSTGKPKTAAAAAKPGLRAVQRVILYVSDFDRAVKFYTETLGVPLKGGHDGWAELGTEGIEIDLHSGRGKQAAGEDDPLIYFRVDDLDATYAALRSRGVKLGEIQSPCGGVRCACFRDPDGNALGIEGK